MAEILKGAPVADDINRRAALEVQELKHRGIAPVLAILRVGEKTDDISYEMGAMKRCEAVGVAVKNAVLPADADSETFFRKLEELNRDSKIHGILMLRPLPDHIDNEKARRMLNPSKDIDGCTDASLAGVFINQEDLFAPCTARAVMEILDYYGVECKGKRAVIVGRSLVVGRPVAMMLMHRDATVTICHTKTTELPSVVKEADIVVVCTGKTDGIGMEYFREGQTVVDVGVGWSDEKGKLCGDVRFDEVKTVVDAITPVPGGVGTVTTSVLVSRVVEAAKRTL